MTANPNRCPEKTTLAEYLLGKLVEPDLGNCEAHVAQCDACEETLRGLSANDTLSQLASLSMERTDNSTPEDERLISNLITQLQETPHSKPPSQKNLENRAAEVTRLLSPPSTSESLGTLAHYDVVELIGAGSTGVVYRAFDQQLHRIVALKILRPSLGESARHRFVAEARSAAAVSHPNVITIFQVGVEGPLAYMAMEWIPGETLEERLGRVTLLSESDVRQIGIQIADGLAAANRKSLIHRDIKPANIWMDSEDNRAIILDFGLARIADDDPQMTATGMLAGTPNFMSPEQTRGLELDGRSDLFSLGCLLYRASTGKLPFGSTGILATLQTIQKETPCPPRNLNPNLSDDFSDLVMCLLEKQPVDRPETAKQLSSALVEPRVRWPFKATEYANEVQPTPKSQIKPATTGPGFTRWIAAAILVTAIGFGGWNFSPQIIRIATNRGELIIDSKDEAVEIEITKNGEVIRVIDTKTDQHIDILAGEYKIRVKDSRNGFELKPGTVVMTRGGVQIVTITRKETLPKFQYAENGTPSGERSQDDANVNRPGEWTVELDSRILDVRTALEQQRNQLGKQHPEVKEMEKMLEVLTSAKRNLERESPTDRSPPQNSTSKNNDRVVSEVDPMSELALFNVGNLEFEVKRKRRKVEEIENQLSHTRQLHERAFVTDRQLVKEQNQLEDAVDELRSAEDWLAFKKRELEQPRYQGKTFDHWLRILETERSYSELVPACIGLGMLLDGDPIRQEEMIVAMTPWIRKHGSSALYGLHKSPATYTAQQLNDGLVAAMKHVTPERLVDFLMEEIEHGTYKSRQFLSLVFSYGFGSHDGKFLNSKPIIALSKRSNEMATALLKKIDSSVGDDWSQYSDLLSRLTGQLWTWQERLDSNSQQQAMRETLIKQNGQLLETLKTAFESDNKAVAAAIGPILAREYVAPDTARLAERMGQIFADRQLDPAVRSKAFEALVELDSAFGKDCIPYLLEVAKKGSSEEKSFEQAMNKVRRRSVEFQEGRGRLQELSIQWQIVLLLSRFGKGAESALPWVRSLPVASNHPWEAGIQYDAILSIEGSEKAEGK